MELDTECEKRLFDLFDINQTTVQELFPGLNDGTDFKDELSNDISKLCLKRKMHFFYTIEELKWDIFNSLMARYR
jgi:hypothetical protein